MVMEAVCIFEINWLIAFGAFKQPHSKLTNTNGLPQVLLIPVPVAEEAT